jgi:hypothetical protein
MGQGHQGCRYQAAVKVARAARRAQNIFYDALPDVKARFVTLAMEAAAEGDAKHSVR